MWLSARASGSQDVSLIVPHQANLRIINSVADRLSFRPRKVFTNVDRYGNTSAASVPIALDEALEQKRIRDNDLIMLCACGGGLTWGANSCAGKRGRQPHSSQYKSRARSDAA